MVGSSASSVSPSLMSDSVGPASIRFRVAAARFIAKGETEPVLLAPRHDILSAIKVMSVSVAGTRGRSIGRLPHLWRADGCLPPIWASKIRRSELFSGSWRCGRRLRTDSASATAAVLSSACFARLPLAASLAGCARQLDRWICLASRIQLLLRSAGQVSSAARAKTIPSRLGSSAW